MMYTIYRTLYHTIYAYKQAATNAAIGDGGTTATTGSSSTSDTWLSRVLEALGPSGYDASVRRSLQTVILYEAVSATGRSI